LLYSQQRNAQECRCRTLTAAQQANTMCAHFIVAS